MMLNQIQFNSIFELNSDRLKLKQVFDTLIDLKEFLTEKDIHSANCYCIFHGDTGKPSATFHDGSTEEDGIDKLWCYVCRRNYTAYNYVTKILEENPISYLLKYFSKEFLDNYVKNFNFENYKKYKVLDENLIKNKSINEIVNIISFGENFNG